MSKDDPKIAGLTPEAISILQNMKKKVDRGEEVDPQVVEGLLPSADLRKRRQGFFIKYQQCLSVGGNV